MKKTVLGIAAVLAVLMVSINLSTLANASVIGGFCGTCMSTNVACQWYCPECDNIFTAIDGTYGPAKDVSGRCACGADASQGTANVPIEGSIIIEHP